MYSNCATAADNTTPEEPPCPSPIPALPISNPSLAQQPPIQDATANLALYSEDALWTATLQLRGPTQDSNSHNHRPCPSLAADAVSDVSDDQPCTGSYRSKARNLLDGKTIWVSCLFSLQFNRRRSSFALIGQHLFLSQPITSNAKL